MIVIYLILGCFFDGISLLLMTVPVVFPVMTGVGFDAVWLGVIVTILIEIGMLTPPVGTKSVRAGRDHPRRGQPDAGRQGDHAVLAADAGRDPGLHTLPADRPPPAEHGVTAVTDLHRHVLVAGAGIVGVSTALQLRRAGLAVTLVDRDEPGRGCSFGDAGIIAGDVVAPIASPGIVTKVPGYLADPEGPLAIRWSYLPALAPWLVRFVGQAGRGSSNRTPGTWHP